MYPSADPTLLDLCDEVRKKTLKRLEDVTEEQARFVPSGLQNSILWHAGHAYVVTEWLTMGAMAAETTCPDGWFEMFSWMSKPEEVSADAWPTLQEVVQQLRVQHGRLHSAIQNIAAERLDQPAADDATVSVRFRIMHGFHDEACHSGEIWLLRKMQGT